MVSFLLEFSIYMDTTHIFQFLTISSQNLNILPQNGKFWNESAWHQGLYLNLGYELPLCKISFQNINKCRYYKKFNFSRFLNKLILFYPKITNFGPIQLGIIANISSNVNNYLCAKFHAFIKKWTMNAIIRWTKRNIVTHLKHLYARVSQK